MTDQRHNSKAEEQRIREAHGENPICEVPADTVSGADAAHLLTLAAAIKREREAQGLTPEQLATRAGVEAAAYAQFEAGHAFNATVSTLFRIAGALGKRLVLDLQGADADSIPGSPASDDEQEQEAVLRYSMGQAAKAAKENPY